MSDEESYTIGELAERAGVTPRTIRYYTAEGLLLRPDTRGQYARYGAEHLLQLQLIARLKAAYLPLHEIRARLDGLGVAKLQALLAAKGNEPVGPSTSAAEYLAEVLGRPAPAARIAEASAEYQPAPELPEDAPATHAPPAQAAAYRLPEVSEPAAASQVRRSDDLLGRLMPERREARAPEAAPPGEAWRRIMLAPGVELHIHESVSVGPPGRLEQLLHFARELFGPSESR